LARIHNCDPRQYPCYIVCSRADLLEENNNNNLDSKNVITPEELQNFARGHGISYAQVSAKTGDGIEKLMLDIADLCLQHEYYKSTRKNNSGSKGQCLAM